MYIHLPTHVWWASILFRMLCFVMLFLVVSVHTDSGSKMAWAQYTCSEDSSTAPPEEPPEACFTPARGPHCERLRWGWGDCPGSPGKACDWCYDSRTRKIVAYVPRTNRTYKLSSQCEDLSGPGTIYVASDPKVVQLMEAAGGTCTADPRLRLGTGVLVCQNVDADQYKRLYTSQSGKTGENALQVQAHSDKGQTQQDLCPTDEPLIALIRGPKDDPRTIPVCRMRNGDYRVGGRKHGLLHIKNDDQYLFVKIQHPENSALEKIFRLERNQPDFQERVLQDIQKIAKVCGSPDVGWLFLNHLLDQLWIKQTLVVIRHGGQESITKRGVFTPFTSPDDQPNRDPTDPAYKTNHYLSPVTRTGIPVHDSTGKRLHLYGSGTGEGTGGRVFYNPEFWPNKMVCPSGMTSDVVLQHELLHAYRYAGGWIDFRPPDANDSFAGKPLTGNFPTKEEIWTVERENLYRAAQTPPIRARKGYNNDC